MTLESALGWNAVVVAVLAISFLAVARLPFFRRRPALRHWLWLLVLIKCVTPPLFPIPVFRADPNEPRIWANEVRSSEVQTPEFDIASSNQPGLVGEAGGMARFDDGDTQSAVTPNENVWQDGVAFEPAADDVSAARISPPSFFRITLVGFWALVTVAFLLRWAAKAFQLSRLVRRADPAPDSLERIVRQAANRLGAGKVNVVVIDGRVSPLIWIDGSGATILFPKQLAEQISDEQIEWIACHEIAHLVRRDQWSNMFAMFVVAFFWWHPAIWLARSEMRKAQELCADETVIRSCNVSRRSYLETLLSALDFVQMDAGCSVAPASGLFENNVVESRFRALAQGPLIHCNRWQTHAVLLLLLAASLCFPANAQTTGRTDDTSLDGRRPQSEGKRQTTINDGTTKLDETDQPNADHATRPLHLHWLKLSRVDDQVRPELILSTVVALGKPFDIMLTTNQAPVRKPRLDVAQSSITGRISFEDGQHFGTIDTNWKCPERFDGPFELDVPKKASAFTWSRGSSPTCVVLTDQPYSDDIAEKTAKTIGLVHSGFDDPNYLRDSSNNTLETAAIRLSTCAPEFGFHGGASLANAIHSNTNSIYDHPVDDVTSERNLALCRDAIEAMFSRAKLKAEWRLNVKVEKDERTDIGHSEKLRFVLDLGEDRKWDEITEVRLFLKGPPQKNNLEYRSSYPPAKSFLWFEFSVSKLRFPIQGCAMVRSAVYRHPGSLGFTLPEYFFDLESASNLPAKDSASANTAGEDD